MPPSTNKVIAIGIRYWVCIWCKRYSEQIRFIREVSRSIPEYIERISNASLSESTRRRIKEAIRRIQRGE